MKINTETINEFLAMASRTSDWENARPGMWIRSTKTDGWVETEIADDPYTTLPIAVRLTPEGVDTEAMFLMYGWMTPLDDEELESERLRIRVIMYFKDGKERVITQVRGESVNTDHDDTGEGMFPDTLRHLRTLQKAGEL